MGVRTGVDGGNSMGDVASVGVEAGVDGGTGVGNKLGEVGVDGGSVMSREAAVGVESLGGRGDGGHQGEQGDGLGEDIVRYLCLNSMGCL